jgi:tRNA(Ile2) C34 agmatinyltransferase TiaS
MKAYCEKCNAITKQKTYPPGYKCNKCGTIYKPDGSLFTPPKEDN